MRTFIAKKENFVGVIGPFLLLVAFSSLWLLSKEAPIFMPSAGLLGLGLVWMGRSTGLWIAETILLLALILSLWLNPFDAYWQMIFASSIGLSLLITSLTQAESIDRTAETQSELEQARSLQAQYAAELSRLEQDLLDKDVYLTIARDEFLHLQQQQRQWSDAVFAERQKKALIEEQLQEEVLETMETPEYRRLNGAYTQLKDQFKEKDRTLSEARRELFQSQEQILALSKDLEEVHTYGVPEEVERLQKHCIELEQRYVQENLRLREENNTLESMLNQSFS